jgi:hypothetical protein
MCVGDLQLTCEIVAVGNVVPGVMDRSDLEHWLQRRWSSASGVHRLPVQDAVTDAHGWRLTRGAHIDTRRPDTL